MLLILQDPILERSYPTEDVNTLQVFKKKYGDPCDVVAKTNVSTLHTTKMSMTRAIKKKLNHILILVCMQSQW